VRMPPGCPAGCCCSCCCGAQQLEGVQEEAKGVRALVGALGVAWVVHLPSTPAAAGCCCCSCPAQLWKQQACWLGWQVLLPPAVAVEVLRRQHGCLMRVEMGQQHQEPSKGPSQALPGPLWLPLQVTWGPSVMHRPLMARWSASDTLYCTITTKQPSSRRSRQEPVRAGSITTDLWTLPQADFEPRAQRFDIF
jgi:hypothetical protein